MWEERPWLFDKQVLVLKDFEGYTPLHQMKFGIESFWLRIHNLHVSCLTKMRTKQIGGSVSKVERVGVQEDGSGWKNFLRVQVLLDLTQPIARGRTVNVRGCIFWAPFSYEKLPKIYFSCGCIVHGVNGCNGGQGDNDGMEEQYGSGLRAKLIKKTRSYSGDTWWKEEGSNWRRD